MHMAKARANKAKASTAGARTRTRIRLNVGTVESVDTTRKTVGARRAPTKGVRRGKHKPKNADAHNLGSKPSIVEPEVEIDEFNMGYLDVDALQQESEKMRGSEWIKIGVDTGAGKTAWPQSITRTERRFLVTTISLSAQQLENLSKVASECLLWVATIGDRISEFEVFKHRCANRCCLLENARRWVESLCCMVTKVTCSTKVRMLQRKLMLGSRRS